MSDIISMQDALSKMKAKELKEYTAAQFKLVETLRNENQMLKEKVAHLEQLLTTATPIMQTDEEIICMEQIAILKNRSSGRELSLDEVKRLDLLIKNLRLIREQSTQVIDSVDYSNMKEADLVAAITSNTQDNK